MTGQSTLINPYEGQRTTPGPANPPVYPGAFPLDLTSLDVYRNGLPQAVFNDIRRKAPVWWHPETAPNEPGFWLLSHHEDIAAVSKDPETFSSAIGAGAAISFEGRMLNPTPAQLDIYRATMVHMDPPEHHTYRRLILPHLMGKTAARLEDTVRGQVRGQLDEIAALGAFDLVERFSAITPALTLCHLLGVPARDREQVIRWGDTLAGLGDPEFADAAATVHGELYAYGWKLMEEKRLNPADDLLSAAIAAYEASDTKLRPGSMEGLFSLMVVAGHRTTRNTITAGLLELYRHPDQLALIREDTGLMPNAIEEILRRTTVVPTFRRTVTRDVVIGGQPIAAGEKVVLAYAAANFDEAVFDTPEAFDVRRANAKQHLTFGVGEHFCAGNMLARMQLRVAIEEFTQRFGSLQVVREPVYLRANQAVSVKSVIVRVQP